MMIAGFAGHLAAAPDAGPDAFLSFVVHRRHKPVRKEKLHAV